MDEKTNTGKNNVSRMSEIATIIVCISVAVVFLPEMPSIAASYKFVTRDYAAKIIISLAGLPLLIAILRKEIRFNTGQLLLFLFAAANGISVFYARDKYAAFHASAIVFCWLIVSLVSSALESRESFLRVSRIISNIVFVTCIIVAIEYLIPAYRNVFSDVQTARAGSTFGYPTLFAGFLFPSYFLVRAGLSAAQDRNGRIIFAAVLILICINLVFTKVVTAWIFIAAAEIFIFLFHFQKSKAARIAAPVAVILMIFALVAASNRGNNLLQGKNSSAKARAEFAEVAGRAFAEHPFAGVAAGNLEVFYAEYREKAGLPNSEWVASPFLFYPFFENYALTIPAELGFPGALLFAAIFVWTFIAAARKIRSGRSGWSGRVLRIHIWGAAALLLFQIFHYPFSTPGSWCVVWLNIGAIWALSQDSSSGKKQFEIKAPLRFAAVSIIAAACVSIAVLCILSIHNDIAYHNGMKYASSCSKCDGAELERIIKPSPAIQPSWRYYFYTSEAYRIAGDKRNAVKMINRAIHLRPGNAVLEKRLFLIKPSR